MTSFQYSPVRPYADRPSGNDTSVGRQHQLGMVGTRAGQCLILLSFIAGAFVGSWTVSKTLASTTECIRPQLIWSPATEAVRYEKRRLYRSIRKDNPYTGPPSLEHDRVWHDLVEPMVIRVSAEELALFDEDDGSIALRDGSGFIAEMTAYHELHCIKRIRRHFHLDRYYPNISDAERKLEEDHMDHCLEYWREAAMCRGDVTLSTFFWREQLDHMIPTSRAYSDHECVNWDILDQWSRARMINVSDFALLDGP